MTDRQGKVAILDPARVCQRRNRKDGMQILQKLPKALQCLSARKHDWKCSIISVSGVFSFKFNCASFGVDSSWWGTAKSEENVK